MHDASFTFLKNVLETPSPSGYERPVQDVVRAWAGNFADEVRTDRHGNVIAVRHPATGRRPPRVMLAGHCDQIGLMVQHIDDNGFLYVQPIGGWDMQILLGQNLTVWAKDGPGRRRRRPPGAAPADQRGTQQGAAVHRRLDRHRRQGPQGGRGARHAPATRSRSPWATAPLRNGLAASPAMDDKVGLWTVMETLRLLHGRPLQAAVYCVSTVQEEIGLRGATTSTYGIHPTVGIAVDVCHATDTPGNDKKQLGDMQAGRPARCCSAGRTSTRASSSGCRRRPRRTRSPCRSRRAARPPAPTPTPCSSAATAWPTGLVGIPNRYMHSPVEVVHLDDLDRAARLLAEFCAAVTPQMDWTP